MSSNFSGYSLASTASPPAATAMPIDRRPLRTSSAPAPIDPNTTAFFQLCMYHLRLLKTSFSKTPYIVAEVRIPGADARRLVERLKGIVRQRALWRDVKQKHVVGALA